MILVCFWLFAPSAAAAEEPIGKGETLDLQRCLAIALERHPSILAAAGTIRAGDSRVGQARSGYYPQISGSAGYNRTDPMILRGAERDTRVGHSTTATPPAFR